MPQQRLPVEVGEHVFLGHNQPETAHKVDFIHLEDDYEVGRLMIAISHGWGCPK
jgi:phosphoribosyl-dephospho-CoA transferase